MEKIAYLLPLEVLGTGWPSPICLCKTYMMYFDILDTNMTNIFASGKKKLYYQSNFPTWSTNFGQMGLKNSWNVYPLSYITGFGTKMFSLGCLFYIYSQQWVTHYFTLNMYWNILNFRVTMGYFSRINIPKTMFKLTEVILLIMYSNLNHLAWFGIKFV